MTPRSSSKVPADSRVATAATTEEQPGAAAAALPPTLLRSSLAVASSSSLARSTPERPGDLIPAAVFQTAASPLFMPADSSDLPAHTSAGVSSGDHANRSETAAPTPPSAAAPPSSPGRLEYLEGLVAAASAINATLDQTTVCQVLVDRATDLLGVPAAAVLLLDEQYDPVYDLGSLSGSLAVSGSSRGGGATGQQQIRLIASKGLSEEHVAAERTTVLGSSIAARALAEARVYATWDVRQSNAVSPAVAQAAADQDIASVACAPMFAHGRALGVLNLYCRAPQHCFSPDQFHVLSLLAAQGAVAVANARLYEKSRVQAREVQASFARVGAALASSLDITQTLRLIVQLAGEMTRSDGGAMFMLDDLRSGGLRGRPDQDSGGGGRGDEVRALPTSVEEVLSKPTELTLSAARGLHRRSIRLFRRVPLSSLAERALRGRKVIVVPDTRRHPDVPFPSLRVATTTGVAAAGDVRVGSGEDGPDTPGAAAATAAMLPARSAVCVPVLVGDRPVGVLEQYAALPRHFTTADVQLLESFALQAAVAIENARLYGQEKNLAQTLQRAFLPDLPDTVGGLEVGRIYVPASDVAAVGGDIYDLLPLSDGRIALMIADVCGHGLHAATLTALAKHTARAYALLDPDPAQVLSRLNDALCAQTGDYMFLTVCYALLDGSSRQIAVASAAHPPVLLCRASGGGCVRLGTEPGMLAGFRRGETYAVETATLAPGDVLVFYTDGVTEARRGKIMFEGDRLSRVVEKSVAARRSAQEIAAAIYDAVAAYAAPGNLADDIALLVVKAR